MARVVGVDLRIIFKFKVFRNWTLSKQTNATIKNKQLVYHIIVLLDKLFPLTPT